MDEQGVDQRIDRRLAKMLKKMAGDCACAYAQTLRAYADGLSAEADRLTPPPGAPGPDQFEGVKYVVWGGNVYRLVGMTYPGAAAILGPTAVAGARPYCVAADQLSPWHPKKDDKVRSENKPERIGRITEYYGPGVTPYSVLWDDATHVFGVCLGNLRPFSFAPPEPEPEKPEFPNGTLVAVGNTARVFMAIQGGHFRDFTGRVACTLDASALQVATDSQIAGCLRTQPLSLDEQAHIADALRAHARHIAKEAGE